MTALVQLPECFCPPLPRNSRVEILNPDVITLRGRATERWLDHEAIIYGTLVQHPGPDSDRWPEVRCCQLYNKNVVETQAELVAIVLAGYWSRETNRMWSSDWNMSNILCQRAAARIIWACMCKAVRILPSMLHTWPANRVCFTSWWTQLRYRTLLIMFWSFC